MIFDKIKTYVKRYHARNTIKYKIRVFILFFGVVMIWRSMWNILEVYFLPEHFLISNLLCLLIGLLIVYFDDYELEDLVG